MTVNRTNMRKFVAALRSGKYEQGRMRLEDSRGRLCCLGVACVVSGVTKRTERVDGVYYDDAMATLPDSVMQWLGVGDADPRLGGVVVTHLNDDLGLSFPEIADAFEAEHLAEVQS